jgi:hypothetical protein
MTIASKIGIYKARGLSASANVCPLSDSAYSRKLIPSAFIFRYKWLRSNPSNSAA